MPCYHPISLTRKNAKRGFMTVPCGLYWMSSRAFPSVGASLYA